ncbi:MAG: hypothetical protein PHP00_02590 [Thiotrichaceae bacterium]|nr:hypothetical protein [Thiotrichaceae bacterium]
MKSKVILFIRVALIVMLIVPSINLMLYGVSFYKDELWGLSLSKNKVWAWNKSVLYNINFTQPLLNKFLYAFGISANPANVIIGKNNWLYLGDAHVKTITVKRTHTTATNSQLAKKIGLATKAWAQWLKQHGVQDYRILLAADKDTIYPEYLPNWAQPVSDYAINTLLANVSPEIYIDTRDILKNSKPKFSQPLYYKTDTHWNSLGGWVAFHHFMDKIIQTEKKLIEPQIELVSTNTRAGGDLGRFLNISGFLSDTEVMLDIVNPKHIDVEKYDFDTSQLLGAGGNAPVPMSRVPLLIKSKNALNQKKVLWLRDSFGRVLSPLMAATFSEVLQLHYDVVDSKRFVQLVNTFKPDYVFISVVEREAFSTHFSNFPPP